MKDFERLIAVNYKNKKSMLHYDRLNFGTVYQFVLHYYFTLDIII